MSRRSQTPIQDLTPLNNPSLSSDTTIVSIAFSPDGSALAAGGWWRTQVWKISTAKKIGSFEEKQDVRSVAFSPNGRILASGSRSVILRDIQSGRITHTFSKDDSVESVAFSADGQLLASAAQGGTKLWDVQKNQLLWSDSHASLSVAFAPRTTLLAIGTSDSTVMVFNYKTGKTIWKVQTADIGYFSAIGRAGGYPVTFSPDGRVLARGTGEGLIECYSAATGKTLQVWKAHDKETNSLAFSRLGGLASGGDDGVIKLWKYPTGALTAIGEKLRSPIYSVAFSPNSKIIVGASRDNSIRQWRVDSPKQRKTGL